jgi:hypothetical protein
VWSNIEYRTALDFSNIHPMQGFHASNLSLLTATGSYHHLYCDSELTKKGDQ